MLLALSSEPVVDGKQGAEDVAVSLVLGQALVVLGFVVPEVIEQAPKGLMNAAGNPW